jgi:acyl-CoA thioester hydrolase
MSERSQAPQTRAGYKRWLSIPTRWIDNDIYGHVNNVIYYSYFDTVINEYLIREGRMDIHNDPVIGITPETFCQFKDSFAFPETVEAGLAVGRLGRRSVTYLVGLFKEGSETPAALGHFVHVFVERETQRPTDMPEKVRAALEKLVV